MTVRDSRDRQVLHILLIDDHALRRAALHSFLQHLGEKAGMAVEVAAFSSIGDNIADGTGAHVALVGSGSIAGALSLLHELRQQLPELPAAVLSETDSTADVVLALEGGARGVISTCIDPVLMLHALRFIAAGGHFFPPKVLLGEAEEAEPPREGAVVQAACGLAAAGTGGLTVRQHEVLRLLQEGQSNKRIARSLGLQESTIKVHVRQIMRKLGVANRTQAALSSVRLPVDEPEAFRPEFRAVEERQFRDEPQLAF